MLGVEVFRDKQGLGQKGKDEGEAKAGENQEQMDSENGGENRSDPKAEQETSS